MTDTEGKLFGGYEFTNRTFRIKASDLLVYRKWTRESLIDHAAGDEFSTSISGRAICEEDSVCVIGTDRETKEFVMEITFDANARKEWEAIRGREELAISNDGTTPELRVRGHVFEELSKAPPTATLFVTVDELGSDLWSVDACFTGTRSARPAQYRALHWN